MMTTGAREHEATRRERIFVDGHQDGIAGRGLSYLILLNGVAAIVMVGAFVYGFQTSAEPKLAAAMLVFGIGAVAGLVSSFIAEAPERAPPLGHCRRDHQRHSLPLRHRHGRDHFDREVKLTAENKTPGQGLGRAEIRCRQGRFPHLSGWG
jgi:hypothetical protein